MSDPKNIKKLGFGLMRLPRLEGGIIDIEQTKQMVDEFLAAGYTYFDTARVYTGSEEAIKEALVDRYPRESYQLATKVCAWENCKTAEDAKKQLEISLEKTGAGYFDYYLLHNVGEGRTKYFDDYGLWDWALEMKKEGKIKHAGFSFHSTAEELEDLLTKHPEMEFVQLQINYADWETERIQSRKCYEVARKHGKPITIMEPIKGGLLANPSQSVKDLFKSYEPDWSPADWALRFAGGLDGITVVLSGMSTIEQLRENLKVYEGFDKLTEKQLEAVKKAQDELAKIDLIPCTECNYCAGVCPMKIGISGTFTCMNYISLFEDVNYAKNHAKWLIGMHGLKPASECVKCGKCEEVCPQHIKIRDELEKAAKALA